MTSSTYVTYKIKGTKTPPSVLDFNGPYILCSDLKKAVSKEKKIAQSGDVELVVQDEQTGKEFHDFDVIPRQTHLLISRRVIGNVQTMQSDRDESTTKLLMPPHPETPGTVTVAMAEQAKAAGSKRRKFDALGSPKILLDQSKLARTAASPSPGRHELEVAELQFSVKRAAGIPSTKLMLVDGPNYKGAVMTNSGHYAVSTIDAKAYNEAEMVRHKLSPLVEPSETSAAVKPSLTPPPEFICMLCQDICRDAAIVPCCHTSFCDECIRDELLAADEQLCPKCKKPCPPSSLQPNVDLRKAISDFSKVNGITEQQENLVVETEVSEVKQDIKQEAVLLEQTPSPQPLADMSQLYWQNYLNQLSLWMLLAQQQQQQQQNDGKKIAEKAAASPHRRRHLSNRRR